MDGLSGAFSAFAVFSLALQMADGVKKLRDFYDFIQEALRTHQDLNVISQIVKEIGQGADNARPHHHELRTSLTALDQCSYRLRNLHSCSRN